MLHKNFYTIQSFYCTHLLQLQYKNAHWNFFWALIFNWKHKIGCCPTQHRLFGNLRKYLLEISEKLKKTSFDHVNDRYFLWISAVLIVHIRTLLLAPRFSEKNRKSSKKPPALKKSSKFDGTIFPIILESILNRKT